MTPEQLARLFQQRSQARVIRFDEMPVPGTRRDDLVDALWRRFFPTPPGDPDVALRKLRLVVDDEEGTANLSVAATLLCTERPDRWLPQAVLQAVHYAGTKPDANYQFDAREIVGPIDAQVWDAIAFVRRNMKVAARKDLGRKDIPQYGIRAVFEALVNAVAHRDYALHGARIRLFMFEDRLELYVPGALANTLTIDSLPLRQYTRNELIVSLLARCPTHDDGGFGRSHMMDRRGEGVPIILDESVALSGRSPTYELLDDAELRLTLWAAPTPSF
jgi:predicted HTH transcriptional regulator